MADTIVLTSGDYVAEIRPFGAELSSFRHVPSGHEFVWQAGEIWPRHAPILFPFVGRLYNFTYEWQGKKYTIEQHGFARDLAFHPVSRTENQVVLELQENTYTLERYPFLFSFRLTFTLNNNTLSIGFTIKNKGKGTMPVSFGGHPAFAINEPEDAIIQFPDDPDPDSYLLRENFFRGETKKVTDRKGQIMVDAHTFDEDALVFKGLRSTSVSLASRSNSSRVTVSLEGWPYLGIWAKPGAGFVCIEPWNGLADNEGYEGPVEQKEGILVLAGEDEVHREFRVEVTV